MSFYNNNDNSHLRIYKIICGQNTIIIIILYNRGSTYFLGISESISCIKIRIGLSKSGTRETIIT